MTGLLAQSAWRSFRGGDASSISLFLKKPLFTRLGGFDEHFGVGQWYGAAEETDFLLRALADSAKLLHCPIARVHHHFPTGALLATHIACLHARRRARGTGAIYAKHRLNLWVVMRGFIAPWLMPLRHGKLQHAKLGIFVTLGRIEGFMRWKLQDHT
jgi:GT2 family glycosyltransferase